MKLADLRNLCDAASPKSARIHGSAVETVSLDDFDAWSEALLEAGPQLLKIAEAAAVAAADEDLRFEDINQTLRDLDDAIEALEKDPCAPSS